MKRSILVLLAACATAAPAPSPSGPETFKANLDAASAVPAATVDSSSPPSGSATFTVNGPTIAYKVAANGLSSAFTAAHIHAGAPGTPGPVVAPLQLAATGAGTAAGEGTIDAAAIKGKNADGSPMTMNDLLAAMRSGALYVNVHTANNKSGEIRGQIKP
jgi:Cu/Zn superoxide dismutase